MGLVAEPIQYSESKEPSTETHPPTPLIDLSSSVAVIDIGSHSVRLVVYQQVEPGSLHLWEDKAICQLARGMGETGLLDADRMAMALTALKRFKRKLDGLGIHQILPVATSAVRTAANGSMFAHLAETILEVPVQVVSGDEEARLSALGVSWSFPDEVGVVADLGGGSLELAEIQPVAENDSQDLPRTISFELGHQRLLDVWDADNHDLSGITQLVEKTLNTVSWLEQDQGDTLFMVGSTFRRIGQLHQKSVGLVAKLSDASIHGYRVSGDEMLAFLASPLIKRKALTKAKNGKRDSQKVIVGTVILRHLIHQMKPEEVVLSGTGLREGVIVQTQKIDLG